MDQQKKYILKPGRHQFAPGEHSVHDNDNLTDEAAKWYLKKYPHIKSLFIGSPGNVEKERLKEKIPCTKRKRIGAIALNPVKSQTNENLSATN